MENELPAAPGSPTVTASAPEVKKDAPDYLSELQAKDARIAQLQTERDNYRSGMLKYKRQTEAGETPDLSEDERFRQIAREELMNSEIAQAGREKEELVKKLARENAELRTAIANKAQVGTMGGSSQPNDAITVEKLASDQKAELEARARELGVDPVKFVDQAVKNLAKIK